MLASKRLQSRSQISSLPEEHDASGVDPRSTSSEPGGRGGRGCGSVSCFIPSTILSNYLCLCVCVFSYDYRKLDLFMCTGI